MVRTMSITLDEIRTDWPDEQTMVASTDGDATDPGDSDGDAGGGDGDGDGAAGGGDTDGGDTDTDGGDA